MSRSFFKMFDSSRTIHLSEAGFDECFEYLQFFIGPMGAGALRALAPIGPVIHDKSSKHSSNPASDKRIVRDMSNILKKLRDIRLKSHPTRPNFETFACFRSPRPETSKHSSKKCAVRANYRDVRQKWILRKIVRNQPWQVSRREKLSKNFRKIFAIFGMCYKGLAQPNWNLVKHDFSQFLTPSCWDMCCRIVPRKSLEKELLKNSIRPFF